MAKTISFSQALTASQSIASQAAVADSPFNPVERTSRVSLYAAVANAGGDVTLSLGPELHAQNAELPVAAAVSTRDHLIATGVAIAGQKITVGVRDSSAAANTINGLLVVEPL